MAVIFIIFIVLNLVIYHKFFDVVYFNLGKGLFKEFAVSFFFAGIETALFMAIGPYLLVAVGIILAICLIVKAINKKRNKDQADDVQVPKGNEETIDKNAKVVSETILTQSSAEMKKTQNTVNDTKMFCPHCGKQILRTIKFCNYCGKANTYNGTDRRGD